jgi:ABC-type glycerol-3-phosphate transport system substrate-binding protein
MFEIDHESPVPIYHQLKLAVKNKIESGEFEPGKRIPTEQELCERYAISRTPVRQALKELVYEGLLVRRRGLGTFVTDQARTDAQLVTPICLMATDIRWAAVIERAAREWNETNPDQRVDLQMQLIDHDELHHALSTAVAEGTAPDMVMIDSVWIAEFADAGFLLPLDELDTDWTHNEYANDLYPAFVEANYFGGHFYGLQVEADLSLLWYRKDWFSAEGLPPPADWDELVAAAQHFARPDVRQRYGLGPYPLIFPGGRVAGEATVYNLLPLIWSAGGTVLLDGQVNLDSKLSQEAVRFIADLVNQHAVAPRDVVNWNWEGVPRRLARGEAALALGGSYESQTILEESNWEEAEFVERIDCCLPPAAPGREPAATAGGMSYAILRQSQHPELVMGILKLAADKDLIADFCRMTYQNSPRPSMRDVFTPDVSPLLSKTSRLLGAARARPVMPEYVKVSAQLQTMFEAVITNTASCGDAVRRAAEFIGAIAGLPLRSA